MHQLGTAATQIMKFETLAFGLHRKPLGKTLDGFDRCIDTLNATTIISCLLLQKGK